MEQRKAYRELSSRQKLRKIASETEIDMLDVESDSEHFYCPNTFENDSLTTCTEINPHSIKTNENIANANSNHFYEGTSNISAAQFVNRTQMLYDDDNFDEFLSTLNLDEDTENYPSSQSDSDDEPDVHNEKLNALNSSQNYSENTLSSQLRSWYRECGSITRDAMTKLLKILRDKGHEDLPADSRTLLKTPRKTIIRSCEPGEYFHYGLETALRDILDNKVLKSARIPIHVNIDELPLTKSTKRCLWPIQGKIVGDSSGPFLIRTYHGQEKPKSAQEYLTKFVDEYENLHANGFSCNGKNYFPDLRCIICDAPARAFCSATKQYNGYFGCSKCTVEGDFMDRMVFLDDNAPLRTDTSFRNKEQKKHHTGDSPFLKLEKDMVKSFPLDYQHLICLGVVKTLILMWLTIKPKFSSTQTNDLSNLLLDAGKYIPSDFNRKTQSLFEVKRWKATNFRTFLLYVGPIILDGFLPNDIIRHFNCLSLAIRILCHPTDCYKYNKYASDLLKYFFNQYKVLYGRKFVTSNVHGSIHLAEDVLEHGPLDTFSAFDFENHMKFLKKIIRKNERCLQQIHRRLAEKLHQNKKTNVYSEIPVFYGKINKILPFGCTNAHSKLIVKSFKFTLKSPDNCCILKDNSVWIISDICEKNGTQVIIGKRFQTIKKLNNYPTDSLRFNIGEVDKLSSSQVVPVEYIDHKTSLFIIKGKCYSIPLLHQEH